MGTGKVGLSIKVEVEVLPAKDWWQTPGVARAYNLKLPSFLEHDECGPGDVHGCESIQLFYSFCRPSLNTYCVLGIQIRNRSPCLQGAHQLMET